MAGAQHSYAQTDTASQESFTFKVPVKYKAKDTMYFDVNSRVLYLYGEAEVDYEGVNLKAHYISIDFTSNEITARGKTDSTGKIS
jgi:hypothetical protein